MGFDVVEGHALGVEKALQRADLVNEAVRQFFAPDRHFAAAKALQVRQRRMRADGMAKRGNEWFPLSRAVIAYDHARHAQLGDVITLDFINTDFDPSARAGIELALETAKELRAALGRVIAAAEFEEAEVRGKGVA